MGETFIFNSSEDCLKSACRPTEYEQKNKIICISSKIIYDNSEFKIAEIEKSDNSTTLVVLIKKAKNKELWMNWIPTKNQFDVLEDLPSIIRELEKKNKNKRTFQF
jgi:hypothetical protein